MDRLEGARGDWKRDGIGLEGSGASGHVCVACRIHRDGSSCIVLPAAQIGRVDKRAASGVQFGNKRVRAASPVKRLEGTRGDREGNGIGLGSRGTSRDVRVSQGIDRDGGPGIERSSAQIGRVDERVARGIQLGDKHICVPSKRRLKRAGSNGERCEIQLRSCRSADDIGVSGGVDGNTRAEIDGIPAKVGGVNEGVARRVQFGNECIQRSAKSRLKGPRSDGKRNRIRLRAVRVACDVGVSQGVDGDRRTLVDPPPPR